jgi:hypothetical protein
MTITDRLILERSDRHHKYGETQREGEDVFQNIVLIIKVKPLKLSVIFKAPLSFSGIF